MLTRRRFVLASAAAPALLLEACGSGETVRLGPTRRTDTSLVVERSLPAKQRPKPLDSNAAFVVSQVRGGRPRGDAVLAIRDEAESGLLRVQTYVTDNGAIYTGRWITVSQKRFGSETPKRAGRIQGVSAVADGAEPSMVSASTDVDGPAFAAEAYTTSAPELSNCSAFAAYDLSDVHSGRTSMSPGFGRKKLIIRGDGGLWWGRDLQNDPFARSDVRLERTGPGHLSLTAPRPATAAILEVRSVDGPAAVRLSPEPGARVELRASRNGLSFAFEGDARGGCGVDPNAAFRDLVRTTGSGPPTSGAWSTGACVVNAEDRTVWWCVRGGTPGQWAGLPLKLA